MRTQTENRTDVFPSARDVLAETRRLLSTPARLRFRLMLGLLCVLCLTLGPIMILDCLLCAADLAKGPAADVIRICGIVLQYAAAAFAALPSAVSVFRTAVLAADHDAYDDPDGAGAPYASGWPLVGSALADSLWCFSSPAAYAACLKVGLAFLARLVMVCLFPAGCVCLFLFGEDIVYALSLTDSAAGLLGTAAVLLTVGLTFVTVLLSGSPAAYGYTVFTGKGRCPFGGALWARRGTRRTLLLLRLRMAGRYILSVLLVLVPFLLIALPCGLTAGAVCGREAARLSPSGT